MNILLTGASRGIGEAIARKIATSGDHCIFLVSRNEEALKLLKDRIRDINPKTEVKILPYDLNLSETPRRIASVINKSGGELDMLINNAGTIVVKEFKDFSPEDIAQQFKVNYIAPAQLIQECIGFLKKSQSSHVVNISSMAGFQGSQKFPGLSHYSASKAAIAALTESLATEYKGEICFNALCIGAVQTEMLAEAFPGFKAPLNADEMAEFICDFAFNAGKYMNGRIIPVARMSP